MANDKILEAQQILRNLGLPSKQQNKVSALTLLALCNLKRNEPWSKAEKILVVGTKSIIDFANKEYGQDYKANTRESFRKDAINPFAFYNIIKINPDEPDRSPQSAKQSYSLTDLAFETVVKFGTQHWNEAVDYFKRHQFPENKTSASLIRKLGINNYKSIFEDQIELGRFNIFIGENGCGKSNILEALAIIGAYKANDLNFEGLYSRGVRIARPDLMLSSFLNTNQKNSIQLNLLIENEEGSYKLDSSLSPENLNDAYTKWINENEVGNQDFLTRIIKEKLYKTVPETELSDGQPVYIEQVLLDKIINKLSNLINEVGYKQETQFDGILSDYAIYDLNTKSLRGITPADSRKTPLGINGEGLDLLIANFNGYEWEYLKQCELFFDWLDSIVSDKDDKNKLLGLKPGRSTSTLYFTDKFMQKKNNTFSAENSNEGILHVLFYIALFISNKTPALFAIDNIETALNPRLCQKLISELSTLSKERGKQVLITTHNPAILDGLNLLDEEIRLFEVYRNSLGHTKTRRIKFKANLEDKKFKLSEMWMKGLLGAVPKNF